MNNVTNCAEAQKVSMLPQSRDPKDCKIYNHCSEPGHK